MNSKYWWNCYYPYREANNTSKFTLYYRSPLDLRHISSPNFTLCRSPAVVGAGIGGSSTAHFLRQHFGPEVQVDVFEKGEVGGRLATVTVNHNDYESGGSIIHSLNLHMQEFVKQLGEFMDKDVYLHIN